MKIQFSKNSKFYKEFYRINVPIFISQLFLVIVGMLNSLIFGQLGERVISAITITDKLNSIYWPIISAIATVMTIYFIQYKGAGNEEGIKNIFILSNILMVGISLITFIFINVFGKKVIFFYSKDIKVISDAYFYLWFIGFSNIIATATYSLITYFNGVGRVKESSIIAIIQTFINFILYYLFVIKIELIGGIKGIVIAVTLTKILEFIFYFIIYKKNFSLKNINFSYKNLKLISGIEKKIFPLVINNLIFMIASNVIFITFSKMGTRETAAIGIADSLIGNFGLLFAGIITSSKIMIGSLLGQNKIEKAYMYSKRFLNIMIVLSLICFILINLFCRTYIKFYKINECTLELSYKLIFIASLFFIVKVLNSLIVDGMLRIGGDIKKPLYNDMVGILIFGVGVSLFFSKVIRVKIEVLYFLVYLNEVIRFILNYKRYRNKKWLKKSIS